MTTPTQPGPRPLLLIAHPGHELRLFGWLRQAKPLIAILTDGSGSTGISRIDLSEKLVAATGGEIVMPGRFAESELYDIMLHADVAPLAQMVGELAERMRAEGTRMIVCDAGEGYHPGHDLCLPLATRAAELCRGAGGAAQIRQCEYRVVGDPRAGGAKELVLALDDATLRDKIRESRSYAAASGDVLSQEVQYMFETYGEDSFRYEGLSPAGTEAAQLHDGLRYYERRGEERVREGRYRQVLRHATHIAPLVAALQARAN